MGVTAERAGIDTWSPAWYLDPAGSAARELDRQATIGAGRGARMLPSDVAGYRVIWNRESALLYAEGHPAEGLAPPDTLGDALEALQGALAAQGVDVPTWEARYSREPQPVPDAGAHNGGDLRYVQAPGFAGVRRLDATVDLTFDRPADGIATLTGVAAILKDRKIDVWMGDGQPETVYLLGHKGRRKLARWYDKGLETGSAVRGQLIRPEDQRRYDNRTRRAVDELTSSFVRGKFQKRFAPLWKASKGVKVAGVTVLADKLLDAVEAGEITPTQAERVAGHLLLESASRSRPAAARVSRATEWRRRETARGLGLVLADGVLQEVEVDLGEALEAVMDAPGWDSAGQG